MNKDVYGNVEVTERVVAEDDGVEDVENEVVLVNAGDANVGGSVKDVDAEVEVDVDDDLHLLKVADAGGKVLFRT